MALNLHHDWKEHIGPEFDKPYMQALRGFLVEEKKAGRTVFPKSADVFRALNLTPLSKAKVVILGQDPYHGEGQAHGLSFSVPAGVRPPPSLLNIYKELQSDLGVPISKHGDLTKWAGQGVLLLNAVLTVVSGQAASHRNRGWEQFTDQVIKTLSGQDRPIVFILWGAYALKKESMIRVPPHFVVKSVHPSPLSAHGGFFGSKPFSKANDFLKKTGQTPIDWNTQ